MDIVMHWIITRDDYLSNENIINNFFKLYEDPSNFPDPNERENPEYIKDRITAHSNTPHTHLLIVTHGVDSEVQGGAIVEFYPESQCVLVTYLFVDKDKRNQGIGKNILMGKEGLERGISIFQNIYSKKIKAIFFESNNPILTSESDDSMNPSHRLIFFKKMGAKVLDIPYIQPALDSSKKPVNNLLMLTFPYKLNLSNELPSDLFFKFYIEFSLTLNAQDKYIQSVIKEYHRYLLNILHSNKSIPLVDIQRYL